MSKGIAGPWLEWTIAQELELGSIATGTNARSPEQANATGA
jgi:hypothetical protein